MHRRSWNLMSWAILMSLGLFLKGIKGHDNWCRELSEWTFCSIEKHERSWHLMSWALGVNLGFYWKAWEVTKFDVVSSWSEPWVLLKNMRLWHLMSWALGMNFGFRGSIYLVWRSARQRMSWGTKCGLGHSTIAKVKCQALGHFSVWVTTWLVVPQCNP